jgi:transcriptional regulator
MYLPNVFAESSIDRARAIANAYPFATLIVHGDDDALEIAHLPFLLDCGDADASLGALRAHVARANPIAKLLLAKPRRATVVFGGPHAYVTPRWYASPGRQVPTWNYAVVHAHGDAVAIGERVETERALADLAARFEQGADSPWTFESLPRDFVDELVPAIVAFRIEVTRVEAKLKLSQNRSAEDRRRVIEGLRARGGSDDAAIVVLMEENERAAGQVARPGERERQ